jgi:predicted RND superfamily exporter protein
MTFGEKLNRIWLLRFFVIFVLLLTLGLAGLGITRVTPFEVQRLLPEGHPVRLAYEGYLRKFDDGLSTYIVLDRQDRPFSSEEGFLLTQEIGQALEHSAGVQDVLGLYNAKFFAFSQGFELKPFYEGQSLTPAGAERLHSRFWRDQLASTDFKSLLISFNFAPSLTRSSEAKSIAQIEASLKQLSNRHPSLQSHMLGTKVASAAFLTEMNFNMRVITPVLLLLIAIFLYFLYRSWQILVWNFVVMFFCYVCTLILIIVLERGLGPYSNFALMFSFIVATTDLIHLFCRFQVAVGSSEERLVLARLNAYTPCLLTSLTTAAGFIGLVLNQNLPIRYFGLYCAFACLLEFVVIFHLLPQVLKIFNFQSPRRQTKRPRLIAGYIHLLRHQARPIVGFSILFLILGVWSSRRLHVDDNFYTKFKADHPLSQAVSAFSREFNFVGSIDVLLRPHGAGGAQANLDPAVNLAPLSSETGLAVMTAFEKDLEHRPEVSRLLSYRLLNNEIDHELAIAPHPLQLTHDVKPAVARFLLDYGLLKDFFYEPTGDFRTVVFLKSLSTDDFKEICRFIEQEAELYKDKMSIEISGFSKIRHFINAAVIEDFFASFLLSFFFTYLCFLYLYRNWWWAFLALLPNALPLVAITGAMGLLQIPVDSNLAILICVAFGISGDNTIHLTYVLKQRAKVSAPREGYLERLSFAIEQVGRPIIATSAIFLFSLPSFLLGHLRLFNQMAVFLSLAFVMAFLSDLFSFPALHVERSAGPEV